MRVVYIQPDGSRDEVEAKSGESVMSTAIANGIDGIIGDCRGGLTCATCHVFVGDEWFDKLGEKLPDEEDMLECTSEPAQEHSRLGCQIVLSEELDGITVHVPESQE